MPKLNFYGSEIDWNDKEFGIYTPSEGGIVYLKFDALHFEREAKSVSKEECIKDFEEFRDTVSGQIRGKYADMLEYLNEEDYNKHKEHLKNAERFFNEVLRALRGN